ncbi:MAG: IPT/TIG domain-containing protein [Bryobacterales bacterium]|nr:IPT/TIG domain-containing protein [Bryobacterales bacterium]
MRLSVILPVVLLALVLPLALFAEAMPRMTTVEPGTAKAGDLLVVGGENLGAAHVAELYLTDGTNDLKVAVTEQNDTSIKFKVPATAKAGRFALMILTSGKGKDAKLIEQPVKVTIE